MIAARGITDAGDPLARGNHALRGKLIIPVRSPPMSRIHDLERSLREHAHGYAEDASHLTESVLERGRHAAKRLGRGGDYRRRLTRMAEDMADEAGYQYRRARRQVQRHPVATVAIVAGTVGAFMLLRRLFRDED
jgi:hypothetical protein